MAPFILMLNTSPHLALDVPAISACWRIVDIEGGDVFHLSMEG